MGGGNRAVIVGTVVKAPDTRWSPAGIPIVRLTLEHRSRQQEAGMIREARFRILVKVAGEALAQQAGGLQAGEQVEVEGFLNRADHRSGAERLVLHAERIERLTGAAGQA